MVENKIEKLAEINSLLSSNKFEEASYLLNSGLLTGLDYDEAIGNYYFYKKDFNKAVECYRNITEKQPKSRLSRYQYLSGIGHERLGDYVEAFKNYQDAIDIDPNFVDAYVELGALLAKVEAYNGAATCYRDAIKLTPNDITLYLNLIEVLPKTDADENSKQKELEEMNKKFEQLKNAGVELPKINFW